MEDQINNILLEFQEGKAGLEETRVKILNLFETHSLPPDEIDMIKQLAHDGLPEDCVRGWGEVKFCDIRQGTGNHCKLCSHFL